MAQPQNYVSITELGGVGQPFPQEQHLTASAVAFSPNAGNSGENVQQAIENVTAGVIGKLISFQFTSHDDAGNEWLSQSSGDAVSNIVPATPAWNCELIAVRAANERNNASANVEIYIAAPSVNMSAVNRAITFNVTSFRTFRATNFTPIPVAAGGKIGVYVRDPGGTKPRDIVVTLLFRVTENTVANAKGADATSFVQANTGGVTVTI